MNSEKFLKNKKKKTNRIGEPRLMTNFEVLQHLLNKKNPHQVENLVTFPFICFFFVN